MNRNGQKGFTLVELMIVLGILGLILAGIVTFVVYVVIGKTAISYAESQTVSDIAAVEYLENQGYRNVRLIETYRVNPQDVDCMPADNAAFRLSGQDSDGVSHPSLTVCCLGSVGETPRCVLVSNQ